MHLAFYMSMLVCHAEDDAEEWSEKSEGEDEAEEIKADEQAALEAEEAAAAGEWVCGRCASCWLLSIMCVRVFNLCKRLTCSRGLACVDDQA